MYPGTRSLKKYVIFPCCLLVFGVMEEIVVYKSDAMTNDYLRVALIMVLFAFGISLLAFVVTPVVERLVLKMHAASKWGAGKAGEFLFVFTLLGIVYWLWFQIVVHGPQSLLPPAWR